MELTKTKLKELNSRQGISEINKMLNKNTEDLRGTLDNSALDTLIKQLAHHVKTNNTTIDETIGKFKGDSDVYTTRLEIKLGIDKLNLILNNDNKDEIVKYFDPDNKNKIAFDNFSKVLKNGITKELDAKLMSETGTVPYEVRKDIIQNVATYLIDFTRTNKISLQELANRIKNKSGDISKVELTSFFTANKSKLTDKELNVFYSELDPHAKKSVKSEQLINVLRRYYTDKPTMTPQVEEALKELARYIKRFDKDLYSFFKVIDRDGDGFLDRDEVARALTATNAITSDVTIQNVMNHFDYTRDGRISLDEFIKTIEPYLKQTTLTRQNTLAMPSNLKQTKRHVAEIVGKNYKTLVDFFNIHKDNSSLISVSGFKRAIAESKVGLTSLEVDTILQNFIEYEKDLVKYSSWLDEMKEYYERETLSESQALSTSHDNLKRSMSAENVFKSLANSIKSMNVKPKDVFKIFDVDGDGVITHSEFRNAFQKMDQKFTYDDITQIIKAIDITNDGKINYGEFVKALKL